MVKKLWVMIFITFMITATACSSQQGDLSDSQAKHVIHEQVVGKFNFSKIPTGRVNFMNGFEASLGGKEQPGKQIYHPRRLMLAKALASMGLLKLTEVSDLNMIYGTYDISLTPEGEKAIEKREDSGMVYFRDSNTEITRLVSKTEWDSKKNQNPEKRFLVFAEYQRELTPLGRDIYSKVGENITDVGKIRAILKFDPFSKKWGVELYDIGDVKTGKWRSDNIEMAKQ